MNKLSSGGAKPRLTSGGEAETKLTTPVQTYLKLHESGWSRNETYYSRTDVLEAARTWL